MTLSRYLPPALLLALSLFPGCTARSGGGGGGIFVTPDAGSSDDVNSAVDSGAPNDAPPGIDAPQSGDSGEAPDTAVSTGEDAPGPDIVTPPPDVPAGPSCGDGTCGKGESCTACPGDCGACPVRCGDGMCASSESCTTCPGDCGACPTTCTATSCGACAENTACGWCRTTNSCLARSGSTCADFVTSATNCTTTPPVNITTACTVTSTTGENDCGFRVAATYTCTPGATVTFGCTGGADAGACGFSGGACAGDPVTRVCAGTTTTGCTFATRLLPQNTGVNGVTADDDACGLCPWVRIACPSAGSVTVFSRAYNVSMTGSCTLARM
jgi:hypothetical protein